MNSDEEHSFFFQIDKLIATRIVENIYLAINKIQQRIHIVNKNKILTAIIIACLTCFLDTAIHQVKQRILRFCYVYAPLYIPKLIQPQKNEIIKLIHLAIQQVSTSDSRLHTCLQLAQAHLPLLIHENDLFRKLMELIDSNSMIGLTAERIVHLLAKQSYFLHRILANSNKMKQAQKKETLRLQQKLEACFDLKQRIKMEEYILFMQISEKYCNVPLDELVSQMKKSMIGRNLLIRCQILIGEGPNYCQIQSSWFQKQQQLSILCLQARKSNELFPVIVKLKRQIIEQEMLIL